MKKHPSPDRAPGKTGFPVLLVPLLLLLIVGAGVWWWRAEQNPLRVCRQRGFIRIGYALEAPYAFLTPNGEVTGESPEIARVVARRLGIGRVEWRLVEFADLIDGLAAGRFDVIAAGLFITRDRARRIAFSLPTFQVSPGLLVRAGNPRGLHSYEDVVRQTDVHVAVLSGSIEENQLMALGCPGASLSRVPDAYSGMAAVQSGQADALALSAPALRWMIREADPGQLEMADPFMDRTTTRSADLSIGGFGFRRNEDALVQAWNQELRAFVGSEEHRRLVLPFGFTGKDIPSVSAPPP